MQHPISNLKDRIVGKKGKSKETKLTSILSMVREFSCLGEIIGRDFEVKDSKGKLIYTIHQKPMAIKQLKTLLKEFMVIKNMDYEREAALLGAKQK